MWVAGVCMHCSRDRRSAPRSEERVVPCVAAVPTATEAKSRKQTRVCTVSYRKLKGGGYGCSDCGP